MKQRSRLVSVSGITVPDFVTRPYDKITDDRDRQSIAKAGIQQPLVLVHDGASRLLLCKGLRRLRIAGVLGLKRVPCVIHAPPRNQTAEDYVRELRLVLDMHRQDLLPSQKCELVEELKKRFGMTNAQVAAYLGIAADSITNWLAVRKYIPPVVAAMDEGRLAMRSARTFDGMSEAGQKAVWKAHEDELVTSSTDIHKTLRAKYSPSKFPKYYRDPKLTRERLKRKQGERKGVVRLTVNEKRRLMSSFEMKELELKDSREKLQRMEREISAAIAPINAIMRNEKLSAHVPEEMREELARFTEIY